MMKGALLAYLPPREQQPTMKLAATVTREHGVLAALAAACATRGGALYGTLAELAAAARISLAAADLDRLYEQRKIDMAHDQYGWYFVQLEESEDTRE